MNYSAVKHYDIANGEGVRISLFVSGCPFHCEGCFNEETWDYNYGQKYTQDIVNHILVEVAKEGYDGLSFLGGDPLCQDADGLRELIYLAEEVNKLGKNCWIWSGFTWEEIWRLNKNISTQDISEENLLRQKLISLCKIWVDGRFQLPNRDIRLQWCGSTNQRVINVQESLKSGKVVLYA